MVATTGCGCAPTDVVRWVVVTPLTVAGAALLAVGLLGWFGRRAWTRGRGDDGPTTPSGGVRVGPTVTGAVLIGLAVVTAVAGLSSTGSLLLLVAGAVVASVGVRAGRTPGRSRSERGPSSAGSAPPG